MRGSDTWKRFSFTGTTLPSSDGRYFLDFLTDAECEVWLDGVMVNEGTTAPEPVADDFKAFGWEAVDTNHPGNIYSSGEPVTFRILANVTAKQSQVRLTGKIIDAWERTVQATAITIPLTNGIGTGILALPAGKFGGFKCELREAGKETSVPDAEVVYSVFPRLKPLKDVADSFFGAHAYLTSYNLAIAEKAGVHWLRMHDQAMYTRWMVVQPEKDGPFVFHMDAVKRAHAMGFKMLGTFQYPPVWAEGRPATGAKPYGGQNFYAPADYTKWDRYVVETVKAFQPYITCWEAWNEQDSSLDVLPGQKREEVAFELMRRTCAAVEGAKLDVTLLGPTCVSINRPFNYVLREMGVTKYLDAYSFHCYGGAQESVALVSDQKWKDSRNRKGQPIPFWMTEGCAGGSTWLRTSGVASYDPAMMARNAASVVKMIAQLKADGIKKYFYYTISAFPSGRTIYGSNYSMVDVNGIPTPMLAAHAAAVYFLEDAAPAGVSCPKVGNVVLVVAGFKKAGRQIKVVWADLPVDFKAAAQAADVEGYKVFDIMGNPMKAADVSQVTSCPLYFVEDGWGDWFFRIFRNNSRQK